MTDDLPFLDEHDVVVAAPPDAVWNAALGHLRASLSAPRARRVAKLLGCDPDTAAGWERPGVGTTVPGFRVVTADRPHLLVVRGEHRFARYAIVLRVEPHERGARCRLESRADFPGPHGRAYRLAVVGSRGHVLAVRRILADVKRRAERA